MSKVVNTILKEEEQLLENCEEYEQMEDKTLIQKLIAENSLLRKTIEDANKEVSKVPKLIMGSGNSKMYEKLKSIARNTIDLEYDHVSEDYGVKIENKEECTKLNDRCNQIYKILKGNISEDMLDLVEEFEEKKSYLMCLQNREYYKQGVISGLTRLKFLGEYGHGIQII